MGQNSVRREGTQSGVPHARDRGWDDDLHGAGEATGAGGGTPEPAGGPEPAPVPGGRAARRRGTPGADDSGTAPATAGGRAAARKQAKKAGKRKVLRWTAIGVAVLVLGTAGVGYAYYEHLNSNIRSGGRAGGSSGVQKAAPNALGDTPLNILLIGSDDRSSEANIALGGSRKDKDRPPLADVQMLLHVSADRQNASLISIPRDTVVKIPECKGEDGTVYPATTDRPINETLTRGGAGCTLTTWETLTGVYVDHWIMVDFAGVVSMADEVGGVPVCVKTGVHDKSTAKVKGGSGLKLPEGTHEVKGEQALQWLRTRHAFGSDQNRAKAQHMYLNGMMKKLQQQNAWTDTGRLMGLAETGTKALKVSDGLDTVAKLFDLGMQLKNVRVDRLSTVTIPTDPYPPNPDAWLQPRAAAAEKIWGMLRDDVALDKNGDKSPAKPKPSASASASAKPKPTAAAPATLAVTVVNGTDGNDEPAVEGRAKKIATALQGKGFTQADSAKEGKPSKGTVVAYPKAAGDQGRADAESVAKALGLPLSTVRADASAEGITLVVGADWREGDTYKRPTATAGDLPEGADDKAECMDVYSVYRWDGKS
ncbi:MULTISPECIES: LCP family protein [Streptomyces]|uniref:LCP family protein n=2 Tax=Streptomyces TaxID=1883 RepID=A0ABU4KA93_9ACTN|nr:LCP family protein [Streptomyces roseolus]MDX2294681.1 LCP family protein [Streptomyces roseolus]